MSFAIDTTFTRTLEKAALALDTIEACRNHKLPDAKKHRLLAETMQSAANRFRELVTQQSVYPADTFFQLAFERLSVIKVERAAVMQHRRQLTEQRQKEFEAMQAQLA